MRFLLDTNIISEIIRNPGGRAATRYDDEYRYCFTSVIVAAEIHFGFAKFPERIGAIDAQKFLKAIPVVAFDEPADRRYGEIRTVLERAGTPIGASDLFIAAHALALDATLVTANEREFLRVPGLKVENWAA